MEPVSVLPVLARAIERQLEAAGESASDPGPDGIHDLRVSTRRLRAALQLWRDASSGKKLERSRRTLRKLGRSLGAVREAEVNLRELSELARRRPAEMAAIELVAAVEARRKRRLGRIAGKKLARLDLPDLSREIRSELAKTLDSGGESASLDVVARRELDRRIPALEELREDALRRSAAPALHRFRIALKKFRYSVEMCAPAYDGRRLPRLLGRLKEIQDALGAAQDARVLHARLAELRAELRADALPAAERALLPPMRAAAALLRERQAAALRELAACGRQGFFAGFEAALRRDAARALPAAGAPGDFRFSGRDAASARL